ncbi:MAG: spermidine synthase, partial [Gemmatimonadetes bacterium]|nr:spermidine synthase [Gemmatimonadota bacterium]
LSTFTASVLSAQALDQLALKFLALYFVLPALLVVPATFLMGCSFPLLQQVVQIDLARVGRRVGILLVANIIGSMLGSVLTGWILLDLVGAADTLKLLAVLGGLFVLLALRFTIGNQAITIGRQRVPRLGAAAAGTVMLIAPVLAYMPDNQTLWARLHGTRVDRIVVGEDASSVSLITAGFDGRATVFVNGVGQSTMPYGDVHTALGAIPVFVHPAPREAAIIGLGSGDTVYAVAGRPEIERIICVEIIRPQLETLQGLLRRWSYGGLSGLLADPRVEHVFGDGRIFLMRGGRKYDIIEADALRPTSAYSGNLYSEEYFRLVRDHLKPNGLAATWLPTERVHNAFVRVFPYVVSVPGMLLGSNDPIEIDREAIGARLAAAGVREYYEAAGIDIAEMMASYLAEPAQYGPDFARDTLTDFNTDLFPKDEYDLARPRR